MKAYLATNFFDLFGFEGTAKIAEKIREAFPQLELYVPQENKEINDKKNNDDIITDIAIYKADAKELLSSQILIAYLDGVEIDAGVAGEIGMFVGSLETLKAIGMRHTPKIVIGLYTDMRQHGTGDNHMYKNLFVKGAINEWGCVVETVDDVIKLEGDFITNYPV